VENFFSIFKRGAYGCYFHVSEAHLHRHAAEFDFRYNNRSALGVEDQERADRALKSVKGKRLTYRTAPNRALRNTGAEHDAPSPLRYPDRRQPTQERNVYGFEPRRNHHFKRHRPYAPCGRRRPRKGVGMAGIRGANRAPNASVRGETFLLGLSTTGISHQFS